MDGEVGAPARRWATGIAAIAFVLSLVPAPGSAAGPSASPWANLADPVFQRIDRRSLAHPAVDAVTQDGAGFIWVGTPAGLARYDGYAFRNYRPDRGDPDAPAGVEALVWDPVGRLWIGTPSSGLMCLDNSTETFRAWRPDPSGKTGPRSATVIALARAANGLLWVGGDSGLDSFEPATGRFERADLEGARGAEPRVEAILVDRAQTVWVATVRGLYRRLPSEKAFRLFAPEGGEGSGPRRFFSLYEDRAGRLWIGSVDRVFVLSPERRLARMYASGPEASALAPGEQWGIVEVAPGIFWVACYDGGISIVDDQTGRVRRIVIDQADPGGLTPGDVWQFFRDRSGLIWVANGPGGLLAFDPFNRGIHRLSSSDKHLGAGDIGARAVAAARDGSLWLGGADRVRRIDPTTGGAEDFAIPNRASVQALAAGADGTLWIGTMAGVCRLAHSARAVDCPAGDEKDRGRVFSLLERNGTLWVGTGSGLEALEERSGDVTRWRRGNSAQTLSNDFVTALYADRAGRIWAGTRNGLNRIDPRTKSVVRFLHDPKNPNSLGPGASTSIVEDRRGRIWAGAVGGPLNVLTDGSGGMVVVRRAGEAAGLPDGVGGLAEGPDGRLWASATSVLVSIDPDTFAPRVLGPADGVQETEFWSGAVATAPDGTMFFAGTAGVTAVAPGASAEWTYGPPIAVTALRIGERPVAIPGGGRGASLALPAGARDVSVEFACLDFSAPDALRYAYRLEGYDREWTNADAAHRVATYTNLAPGAYRLRVRGTNRRGVWSANTLALDLRALPAWYETAAFRLLLAAVAAVLVYLVIRARTRVLRRRAERLEEIVAERTNELAMANARLEDLTITDALTGLKNRRFLAQRIDDEIALALRQGTDLVFFLVDIDHFKRVNDEFGHAAGDRVLAQMRERLEQVFRSTDYILRWGGEEFLAVARASRREDAPELAERLRVAIAERPFLLEGGQPLPRTASIGFATFPFVPSVPRAIAWSQVVELADQALYRAKSGGRNTWAGFAATSRTDPGHLSRVLATAPEDAASSGALEILGPPADPASIRMA